MNYTIRATIYVKSFYALFIRAHLHEQTMINCVEIVEKHAKNMNQGFRFRHTYSEVKGIFVPPHV